MAQVPELTEADKRIYHYSRTWALARARTMRRNFRQNFDKQTGKQARKIRGRVKTYYGEVEKIAFSTYRYGMILAAGSNQYQLKSGTHPGVKAKDWIGPAIEPHQKELADYVAAQNADAVVKVLRFNQHK